MSLRYAILGVLSDREMSGYDFKAVFEVSVSFFWAAKLSQVYKELGALESEGLISSRIEPQTGKPDRKLYKATEEGKKEFDNWIMRFPDRLASASRDEFTLRIYFSYRLPPAELLFELKRYIRGKQRLLETYDDINKQIEASQNLNEYQKFIQKMCLQKGCQGAAASIQWAESFIDNMEQKYIINNQH